MKIASQLNKIIRKIKGLFPSRIPSTGMTEFESWAQDIYNTYDMPTQDYPSIRVLLATILLNLDEKKPYYSAYKPKFYFAMLAKIVSAKQIAGEVFYQRQQENKARQLAEAKKQQEATEKKSELSIVPNPAQ